MQLPTTGAVRVRVGEFEVDIRAGELRHNGDKIKLQERPFQILAALLLRPGEVVTREEIQQMLWPANTFVDFEHSINTAVKKLREAFGDDPESPRFIETLPRHGYRLIAPAETPRQKRWLVIAMGGALVMLLATLIGLNVAGLRDRLAGYVGVHSRGPV